eukprot:GHVR01081921.1.p1 GENE.GHVR01081921.1~~GHVR01081921.1.p1  ORF type:complete len:160 (+),score=16.77 GHVR01081921.1:2-481(+)
MSVKTPKLRAWSDASYKLHSCQGRAGFEIQLLEQDTVVPVVAQKLDELYNIFSWKSMMIKRNMVSSTSAELVAMQEAVKRCFGFKKLIDTLWGLDCKVEILIDSNPLTQQLKSKQCKSEPRLQGMLECVIEDVKDLNASVVWVPTDVMLADRQTKLKLV